MKHWLLLFALAGLGGSAVRAEEAPPPEPNAPLIDHAPVTTVLRGQPAHVVARIAAQGGSIVTSVTTFVRLADVGKPISYPMAGGPGDGAYNCEVPVSLIRGVQRFWYFVDARDSAGRLTDTVWYPVRVIDAAEAGGGSGGGLFTTRNALVAGGLLLLGGGAAAVIEHNQQGGDEDPPPPPVVDPPQDDPPAKEIKDDEEDEDQEQPPPPCITTGSETVTYDGDTLNPFDQANPIELYLCNTCSNASIRIAGSWGEETLVSSYDNPSCDPAQVIQVNKPRTAPSANSQTIEVYSNGVLINSIPWPSNDFF